MVETVGEDAHKASFILPKRTYWFQIGNKLQLDKPFKLTIKYDKPAPGRELNNHPNCNISVWTRLSVHRSFSPVATQATIKIYVSSLGHRTEAACSCSSLLWLFGYVIVKHGDNTFSTRKLNDQKKTLIDSYVY